jgi:hypothetical protein
MTSIAIITAIFGDHDTLKPLPEGHGFDQAVCVTDNPNLVADGWDVTCVPGLSIPRLEAKFPKMRPFDYVDTDVAVWVDAAFQVNQTFGRFAIDALGDSDIVVWDHPEARDCLFQEASYCQDWPKYADHPIREQTEHYRAEGMPEHFGLWACGAVMWRNTPDAIRFGEDWLDENLVWSIQDQVSFPFLVWRLSPRLGVFPAHEFQNPHLTWHPHQRND